MAKLTKLEKENEKLRTEFGSNLKLKYKSLGYTQDQVLDLLSSAKTTKESKNLLKYESGERFPSTMGLAQIKLALGLSYHELFDFDQPPVTKSPALNKIVKLLGKKKEAEIEHLYHILVSCLEIKKL